MDETSKTILYPRKIFIRSLLKGMGRLLISLAFRIHITGKENFPPKGPLIVVGNHTAIMEAVLLNVYTPWQIEMLGAADIPHEKISQRFSDLYGFIPVNRGHVDRAALRTALSVLEQKGVIGIFPEGGIWEPGFMRAQTGVAWLSYRGKTPVLPIGFSGTLASLDKALKLQRPRLTMQIGKLLPHLENNSDIPRKFLFENYAEEVMTEVRALILPTDPSKQVVIGNERFELSLMVKDQQNYAIPIPKEKQVIHASSLVKFLHRPAILKLFYANLNLPIEVLLNLDHDNDPQAISDAVKLILQYLEFENPYLLSYRFGPKVAEEMKLGLEELLALSQWVAENGWLIYITPIRKYYSLKHNKEIIQTKQDRFTNWM